MDISWNGNSPISSDLSSGEWGSPESCLPLDLLSEINFPVHDSPPPENRSLHVDIPPVSESIPSGMIDEETLSSLLLSAAQEVPCTTHESDPFSKDELSDIETESDTSSTSPESVSTSQSAFPSESEPATTAAESDPLSSCPSQDLFPSPTLSVQSAPSLGRTPSLPKGRLPARALKPRQYWNPHFGEATEYCFMTSGKPRLQLTLTFHDGQAAESKHPGVQLALPLRRGVKRYLGERWGISAILQRGLFTLEEDNIYTINRLWKSFIRDFPPPPRQAGIITGRLKVLLSKYDKGPTVRRSSYRHLSGQHSVRR